MRHRHSGTVENALALSVFELNRRRTVLAKGPSQWSGEVEWRRSPAWSTVLSGETGRLVGSLHLIVEQTGDQFALELVGLLSGPHRVNLIQTPCYFGGVRYWFQCPGGDCGKRVAKLYLPPGKLQFLCRHCHNLIYRTCRGYGRGRRYAE